MIISKRMRQAEHVARMGRVAVCTGFWWVNLRERDNLEDPAWEDNIKMDFQELGCGGMDWIDLAQDRDRWRALVNAVVKLWFP